MSSRSRTRKPRASASTQRGGAVLAASALAVVLLAGCSDGSPDAAPSPSPDGVTPASYDPDQLWAGHPMFLQIEGSDPIACFGAIMESYPPQCGGPAVVGLDWADVPDAVTASGVTFGNAWAVGTFDGTTFTLTQPASEETPDGVEQPDGHGTSAQYARLCEDPWRGGDPERMALVEGPDGPTLPDSGWEALPELQEAASGLPGYIETYVSDGVSEFNVLLTEGSDIEAAHAALREVWPGWLCVGTSDVPDAAQVAAATEALSGALGHPSEYWVDGWGADTIAGTVVIDALVDTPELRTVAEEALAPWYSPEAVVIRPALIPVAQ